MNEPRCLDYQSRDYPVSEDMVYQLKVWRFERRGWYVLVAIVVMALAGAFSRGPISARAVKSDDGKVTVNYEMFHRNGSTNPMKVVVLGRKNSQVVLVISDGFFEGFSIKTMQPNPVKAASADQEIRLLLPTDSQGRATLYLTLQGDGLGRYASRISLLESSPVDLTQYILP